MRLLRADCSRLRAFGVFRRFPSFRRTSASFSARRRMSSASCSRRSPRAPVAQRKRTLIDRRGANYHACSLWCPLQESSACQQGRAGSDSLRRCEARGRRPGSTPPCTVWMSDATFAWPSCSFVRIAALSSRMIFFASAHSVAPAQTSASVAAKPLWVKHRATNR